MISALSTLVTMSPKRPALILFAVFAAGGLGIAGSAIVSRYQRTQERADQLHGQLVDGEPKSSDVITHSEARQMGETRRREYENAYQTNQSTMRHKTIKSAMDR